MKVTIEVQPYPNDPTCPKCLRCVDPEELQTEAFHMVHIEDTFLLLFVCKGCGHNWLVQTADAE